MIPHCDARRFGRPPAQAAASRVRSFGIAAAFALAFTVAPAAEVDADGATTAAAIAWLPQKAAPSRLAEHSLMLDLARAGDRLVTVGERGWVLLSDDSGKTWRQSTGVPVAVTLTAVGFADARNGWATGHAGVVLHTADAGETWHLQLDGVRAAQLALNAVSALPADDPARRAARQLVADGPDKPFLALEFTSARSGTVVGAYGLIFSTNDGGVSWVPRLTDTDNPGSLHLNAIRTVAGTTYIVGEKGLMLKQEAGGHYRALASPYDGSWFVVDAMPGAAGVVVGGLRGHVYFSDNEGANWQKIDAPSGATLSHSLQVGKSLLLLTDQGGSTFALNGSRRLVPLARPSTAPVTSLAVAADGSVVATTLRGPVRSALDFSTVIQTTALAR